MGSFVDLTGQTFGLWHVDSLGPKLGPHKTVTSWMCTCKCGTHKPVRAADLINGKSLCCGCQRPHEDLVGQRFGRLEVLYELDRKQVGKRRKIQYQCICDCGNEVPVLAEHLKSGNTSSCGCLQKEKASLLHDADLVGKKYGRLTVIEGLSVNQYQHRVWKCKCDCGNYVEIDTGRLNSGSVLSCGCYRRELFMKDLAGNKYGLLTVKSYAGQYHNGGAMWLCQCECGKLTTVRAGALIQGSTMSCGCLKQSHLEIMVTRYLSGNFYNYRCQVTFDDLIGIGGGLLSYDFGILNGEKFLCLIECQGRQHYESIDYFGGEDQFESQKEHDRRKMKYAEEHGIKLIEVPYTFKDFLSVAVYLDEKLLSVV